MAAQPGEKAAIIAKHRNNCLGYGISEGDTGMIIDFLSCDPKVLVNVPSEPSEGRLAYISLAYILKIVKSCSNVLEIIDSCSDILKTALTQVRRFSLEGSWLDSFLAILSANADFHSEALEELRSQELTARDRLCLGHQCVNRNKKELQDADADLHKVTHQKKDLLDGRAALDFNYTFSHDDDDDDDDDEDDEKRKAAMKNCLKQLSTEDAALVSDFLCSHPNVNLVLPVSSRVYTCLAKLLQLVKRHTLLEIIDSHRSEALEQLLLLGGFSSDDGSWLESLQHSVSSNSHLDSRSVQELLFQEISLLMRVQLKREVLEGLNALVQNAEADLHKILQQKKAFLDARAKLYATKFNLHE